MKYLFKLALKNILRAKRRTVLTFLILSFGVIIYLFFEGMMEGFDHASFQNYIDFETGHYKIRSTSWNEDTPYDAQHILKNYKVISEEIAGLPYVTGVTSRILFLAEVDNGIDSSPSIIIGIDPENDQKVFSIKKFIEKGKLEPEGAIIGSTLAKDMGISMGDTFFITFRNSKGMYTSTQLIISGIIRSTDPKVNSGTVFINLTEARDLMLLEGVSEVVIKTSDFRKTESWLKNIKKFAGNTRVETWQQLSSDFAALMATKRKGGSMILLFIVIIALVGIINTLLISVYEKRQEIGTLMALGMDNHEVRNIFIFEGLVIGLTGSLIGLALGSLLNLYFIYNGIDYTAMMGENDMGINVMGVVKSAWVASSYVKALIISVAASVLSSYYPAKKVMRMSPVECLRTVQ